MDMTEKALPWMLIALALIVIDERYGEAIRAVCKRKPGEALDEAWARGLADRMRHQQAHARMLGSPRMTFLACVATLYGWLGLVTLCVCESWAVLPAVGYYAIGVVVAARLSLNRHPSWPLLRTLDRAFCRGFHAWIWPVHAWRGVKAGRTKADEAASFKR